ncbi:hypothetical protein MBLNU230_g6984t1 [Neophaeotheca triangularis]
MPTPNTQPTNLATSISQVTSPWSPKHLLTLNNSHSLKVAKLHGDFIWHSHPDTDELFYCVSGGPFVIDIHHSAASAEEAEEAGAEEVVEVGVGDVFCVPRGVQHRPRADVETGVLLIEKVGTVNTGDREGGGMTSYVVEE